MPEAPIARRIALALAAGLLALATADAQNNRIVLKTPIAFASDLVALGTPIVYIAETLQRVSGGQISMRYYEPGKLAAPFEILDAVSSGDVNSGYATALYWSGKIPAAAIFASVPFGPEAPEFMSWLYEGDGLKLYQEMYDVHGYNVHVEPCAVVPPEAGGWFKEKVESPDGFKGLNIRFFGLGGKVVGRLGANAALVPGGELAAALENGTLDASEFSFPSSDERMELYKLAKHNYFPGWHQQSTVFELLVNKNVWEQDMNETQRAIVQTVCRASMAMSIAKAHAAQAAALARLRDEHGASIERWDDEMLAVLEESWNEVLAENLKDELFKKVWENFQAFHEPYSFWESNAFLPRR